MLDKEVDKREFAEAIILTFSSENELTKHIGIHKQLSIISLFLALSAIISLVFFILFLIAKMVAGFIVCFLIFAVSTVLLVKISRYYKKEMAKSNHYPYEIILAREFDFDEIKRTFLQQTSEQQYHDFPNDFAFFCFLNKIFKNRFLLIHTSDFDKSNFDSIKKRINKIINNEYKVSQWTPRDKVRKMMRTNIIITNEMNELLYAYLSNNAGVLLRRAEGIINFAVVKNRLVVPPLFGDVDIIEISRYKNSIKLIKSLLK